MTSEERFQAAVRLEAPDRVPVAFLLDSFAARHAGITMEDWVFRADKAAAALDRTVEDLGGCDALIDPAPPHPEWLTLAWPMKLLLPGRELPPDSIWQLDERPWMTAEDYDTIIRGGLKAFWADLWPRLGVDMAQLPSITREVRTLWKKELDKWQARGMVIIRGGSIRLPFDTFAYARSLQEFSLDLYRRPHKVLQAQEAALEEAIQSAKDMVAFTGIPRVFVPGSRGSATFLRRDHFERFFFPYLKRAMESLVQEGLTPFLHFDNEWTPFLPYLRELPLGCILHVDGSTDLFQAKKVLGGHMCLMGDVPAALLTLGAPAEVADYCKRLIDVVGKDGGFILAQGCTVPGNARFENVRTMVEIAQTYGVYS